MTDTTAVFDLPQSETEDAGKVITSSDSAKFLSAMVMKNSLWFCGLRWLATGLLVAVGIVSFFSSAFIPLGIHLRPDWPLGLALILGLCNLGYVAGLRYLLRKNLSHHASKILGIQIIVDLLLLTAVIHFVGSVDSPASFFFLVHIVLSCIFLPRRYSLMVLLFAFFLYSACLFGEFMQWIPHTGGIFTEDSAIPARTRFQLAVQLGIQLSIWLTIWKLSSQLAADIQKRDRELAVTNQKLVQTQNERTRHMLRTTHELKAPFAAIHANTQLLLNGYCGPLPSEALPIIHKIAERSHKLTSDIQRMLQLANLSSVNPDHLKWISLDLADVIRKCVEQHRPQIIARNLKMQLSLHPAVTATVEDHMSMFFSNLITNAVSYSHPGGLIEISCETTSPDNAVITVADHGIGIVPEKLPRIFEEYYRTEEAAAFNKSSSGLGLAIVRTVAHQHHIRIRVESTLGQGTKFISQVPLVRLNRMKQVFGFLRRT